MTVETLGPKILTPELTPELIEILGPIEKTNRAFTLDWLREQGYEGENLPYGEPRQAHRCVVAVALGKTPQFAGCNLVGVAGRGATGYSNDGFYPDFRVIVSLALPREVERFVTEFDRGKHPDLVL